MSLKRFSTITILAYIIVAVLFYFIAGDSLHRSIYYSEMVSLKSTCGEIVQGSEIRQNFTVEDESLEALIIMGATYDRVNDDILEFEILDETGTVLATSQLSTNTLENGGDWLIALSNTVDGVKGKTLTLSVTSQKGTPGNAVTFCYGDSYPVSKYTVPIQIADSDRLTFNGTPMDGILCMSVVSQDVHIFGTYYWHGVLALGLVLTSYFLYCLHQEKKGKHYFGDVFFSAFNRYGFLIKMLVSRDFKTKYKRSVLGIFWSFLNPLLTMLVLYFVFSTLFVSGVENYPVYLLSGLICWNFFSEATTMCLQSITGNAPLITKVYVPKYIYPLSRALSSLINFFLAFIPLFVVMIITKVPFKIEFLLLLFGIACLFLFSLGIGMILASAMVFFRDTQFLWGVVSMLWMYLTPIFYMDEIIPAQWMTLYKMNPLYHIIRIFRIILLDGVSPEPKAYLLCMIATLVPLLCGLFIFKRTQDKFVLYL